MNNQRRNFLAAATTLVGGTATGAINPLQASPVTAELDVLRVIARYGTCQATSRQKKTGVKFTVKMRSVEEFVAVFNPQERLPFDNIHVGTGNTLSFAHHGTRFTLRNVA